MNDLERNIAVLMATPTPAGCPLCGARIRYQGLNSLECWGFKDCANAPASALEREPDEAPGTWVWAIQQAMQGRKVDYRPGCRGVDPNTFRPGNAGAYGDGFYSKGWFVV